MDHMWILILATAAFCRGAPGVKKVTDGRSVTITCTPESGTLTFWFRIPDKSGIEFMASFTNNHVLKAESPSFRPLFQRYKGEITLKSFDRDRDGGLYGCASLFKGNELKFGKMTRLYGEEAVKQTTAARPTEGAAAATTEARPAATAPCACQDQKDPGGPSMDCAPLVLGPLAGGCGLLLLLLVATVLHCNKIRTRRCPHHYKRKLRDVAPEKQAMTNRRA